MKRLREISRFECEVRVLRNGFCGYPLRWWDEHSDIRQGDKWEVAS